MIQRRSPKRFIYTSTKAFPKWDILLLRNKFAHGQMPASVPDYVRGLEQARKELNKVNSPQLHSQNRRDSLRALVEEYFNEIRPSLMGASEQDKDVAKVDNIMQELLVLCHKQGIVRRYQTLISNARKGLIVIDARIVSSPQTSNTNQMVNNADILIIQTLKNICDASRHNASRYSNTEIRTISTFDLGTFQKDIDKIAKNCRELDIRIQEHNWTIDIGEVEFDENLFKAHSDSGRRGATTWGTDF